MASIIVRRRDLLTRLWNDRNPHGMCFLGSLRFLETLAYEEVRVSEEKPYTSTALVLHGLLGSGRNWRSFSRNLASQLSHSSPSSEWRMVLVDLRNHGRSAEIGFDPPHDMVNAAKDLADLVRAKGWDWPDVVIGHSMGGKVGLQYLESCANGDFGDSVALPKQVGFGGSLSAMLSLLYAVVGDIKTSEQLWVLDSVPGEVSPRNEDGEVEKVLKTLQTLPSSVPSRRWLVKHMMDLGFSKSLSDWIGSNLKKSGDHETWAFNLDGAIQMFNSYREKSYWSLLEHPPASTEIAMVVAEKSDRWDSNIIQRLNALASRETVEGHGKLSVTVLPKAGHWVHVDNPKGLLDIIAPKMASLA